MIPRRSGRIVTIGSIASQTGGLAAGASYAASKGGVAALTKSIARYGGPHGITANCVDPGVIDTADDAGLDRPRLWNGGCATPLGAWAGRQRWRRSSRARLGGRALRARAPTWTSTAACTWT